MAEVSGGIWVFAKTEPSFEKEGLRLGPEWPALAANLCPFSWRREVTCFDEDFGEAVGEAVEANANSVV